MGLTNLEKVGTLQDEALKRRQKLLALKRNKKQDIEEDEEDDNGPKGEDEELPPPQILFRNYRPKNEELEDSVVPTQEIDDIENIIQQQLEDGEKASKNEVEVEIANLAPKKITFDLKRGIQEKLDKLERRTDKAIAELIRQRLKEGKQQDFFIAVNAGARAQQKSAFDSDED